MQEEDWYSDSEGRYMPVDNSLRNIGIVAHVDAGKTTITEYMLYYSGMIRSPGSVDKGTARTDWLDVERMRGISVRAASTSFSWKGVNINLIDTPGHVDFSSEVERSLRVLDGVILVVSAVEGVQAQTEVLWKALRQMNIPALIFVNKIDRTGSDVKRVLEEIRSVLSPDAIPIQCVSGEGTESLSISGLFDCEPGTATNVILELKENLTEFIAGHDDCILEKYVQGVPVDIPELGRQLISLVREGRAYPVLYGAAARGKGIPELLDAVVQFLPPPVCDADKPVSGVVFKIEHDKTMGRIAHVRLYSGVIKNRDSIYNVAQDTEEKVTQIRKVYDRKYEDTGILKAGDIAAVCGFTKTRIGDILGCADGVPPGYRMAVPLLKVQAFPKDDSQYPQLVNAMSELSDEDPLLEMQWIKEERELHVNIMGTIQLEVLTSLLKSRYNLDVTFGKPSVIYKETPSRTAEGFVSYTMPKPCWAVLRFLIEPGERGSGLKYSSVVRDEDIPKRYQNQVEKTVPEALKQGLYGWEVTDLKVTLIAGEYHVMHTHPLDFIVATPMGIMDGLTNAGTTLLEPILNFRISVPEEAGRKVMGDMVLMRADFDSPVISNGTFTVEGTVPLATSLDYPVRLGSISAGRGIMTTSFYGYRECPLELGATTPRRGIDPRDRSKYILSVRKALHD